MPRNTWSRRAALATLAGLAVAALPTGAGAQEFPSKPTATRC